MSGKNNEHIKKVKAVREQKPLPDWYDGAKYVQWETVENRFTGDKALLSPNEVAMYDLIMGCLLYTSPSPRDKRQSRMPSSA